MLISDQIMKYPHQPIFPYRHNLCFYMARNNQFGAETGMFQKNLIITMTDTLVTWGPSQYKYVVLPV